MRTFSTHRMPISIHERALPRLSAHTPGPLSLKAAPNGDVAILVNHQYIVAECFADIRHKSEHATWEALANAKLYAAAPDLYDAADNALNALIGCCIPGDGVDDRKTMLEAQAMLRAAIAKARS